MYHPPILKKNITPVLFRKIHRINDITSNYMGKSHNGVLSHLTNIFEAYAYVYYVAMVDKYLNKKKGKIVDWGGFMGQVTVLLRALGYNCENNVISFPKRKRLFKEFDIPFKLNKKPKILPYKNKSLLALISSGVLEHVQECEMTDQEALKEIYRVLKGDGYFFCWNLPKKYSILEFLARLHGTSVHKIRYTEKQFKKMLIKEGFEIVYIGGNSGVLNIKGMRNLFQIMGPWTYFVIDYYASKLPLINIFSHHITAIARKPV